MRNLKIMLSAGEASGDLHGQSLAKAILKQVPQAELIGFGGEKMASAGVRLCADMKEYSIMGIWEVIKSLSRIFALLDKLTDFMAKEKPDLLVLIDYPDFNWRLAARAKKMGIPVFSYIPPSAWAWRKGRAKKCAALADELAAIFPFELPVYQQAGANITFQGNPLLDTVVPTMDKEEARKYFQVPEGRIPVLLLPGSRRQEISRLLPIMVAGAELLQRDNPELEFYLPIAPGLDKDFILKYLEGHSLRINFTSDNTYDLMQISLFAIATSGTVILEAAILGLPCVALYRMAALNYFIGKLLVDIDYFTLPNILAGKMVQTELLQDMVTPENIFLSGKRFYSEKGYVAEVKKELQLAIATLGGRGASDRVAKRIIEAARAYGGRIAED